MTALPTWMIEAVIRKCMEGKSVKDIAYDIKHPASTVYAIRERFPLFCKNPVVD